MVNPYGDVGEVARRAGKLTYAGRGPKNYVRSDDRLREDVSDQLMVHPDLDATDIEVRVKDGEVTLTGTVPNRDAKRLAENIVDGILGVREVHTELRTASRDSSNAQPTQRSEERASGVSPSRGGRTPPGRG
jgi:osmotically-inducible protein OsmY